MVIALLAVAALGLLAAGVVVDVVVLSYGALGVCALVGVSLLGERVVRSRRASAAAGTGTVPADDHAAVPENEEDPASRERSTEQDDPAERGQAAGRDDDWNEDSRITDGVEAPLVFVAPGRKRFHRRDCDLLTDVTAEEITLAEAQAEGFSPCSVCHPAGALAT